ncbi:MAG: 2-dehydropantoate 2-reductase [Actinomycetota bacterium]|nr:2-dehydropantoate 2-reductase [Actinomycetota bacterium]
MNIAVLGVGGVGGLIAALLSRAGDDVTCLGSASTVAVLAEHGLRVQSERFGAFTAEVAASERLDRHVDLCIVAVKATDLGDALERVPPEVLGGALLVPLLNCVEHVDELRRRYPDAAVAAASIRVSSSRLSPGEIRHDSPFAAVQLATSAPTAAVVRQLAAHLSRAGLDVQVGGDDTKVLWDKLAFLAPLALLTTHTQAPAGVVREQRRDALVAVVGEVAAVAAAEGAVQDEQAVLAYFDSVPASMQSSMQRDWAAGRPTEIEAIGGAVLRSAARHGVAVPVTSGLVDDLRNGVVLGRG